MGVHLTDHIISFTTDHELPSSVLVPNAERMHGGNTTAVGGAH